jgi:acyl carrier protein
VMELVTFIQDEYSLEVADEDITEANLGSIAAIERYVTGKLAHARAA